jgi:hypothetical protein
MRVAVLRKAILLAPLIAICCATSRAGSQQQNAATESTPYELKYSLFGTKMAVCATQLGDMARQRRLDILINQQPDDLFFADLMIVNPKDASLQPLKDMTIQCLDAMGISKKADTSSSGMKFTVWFEFALYEGNKFYRQCSINMEPTKMGGENAKLKNQYVLEFACKVDLLSQ